MATLSKTQIDRLGDRLRRGPSSEADLRLLDEYRRSFGPAYESVIRTIREGLQLEPTGRPAKSTTSIVEKLRRESIRLSQIQDIAGCRVVVEHIAEEERVVGSLRSVFPGSTVIDRGAKPSFGYRAVHVIARTATKLIEIQVRTYLQHLWAELSEKSSDLFDPALKYGGGEAGLQQEHDISRLQVQPRYEGELQDLRNQMSEYKKELVEAFLKTISALQVALKQKNDLLN
jgi:ppGpp synthetase/RelA/SpoT-type nucleotidyltranferase